VGGREGGTEEGWGGMVCNQTWQITTLAGDRVERTEGTERGLGTEYQLEGIADRAVQNLTQPTIGMFKTRGLWFVTKLGR
jgi:hypothetical protein